MTRLPIYAKRDSSPRPAGPAIHDERVPDQAGLGRSHSTARAFGAALRLGDIPCPAKGDLDAAPATALRPKGPCCRRVRRCPDCPEGVAPTPVARLLLSCLQHPVIWLARDASGLAVERSRASCSLSAHSGYPEFRITAPRGKRPSRARLLPSSSRGHGAGQRFGDQRATQDGTWLPPTSEPKSKAAISAPVARRATSARRLHVARRIGLCGRVQNSASSSSICSDSAFACSIQSIIAGCASMVSR